MEGMFTSSADQMGAYTGVTQGGMTKTNVQIRELYAQHFNMINLL